MTRATVYGLAMLAAILLAVFAWKAIIAAGVTAGAWRFLLRRAREETSGPKVVRFGLLPSIAMLYASWNTRRIGRRR